MMDLKHALRRIGRSPGTSALAALSLALAFAPSVAVFSVMDRLFLAPLPVKDPAEMAEVHFRDTRPDARRQYSSVSYPDFREFRGSLSSFSGLAYARRQGAMVTLDGRRILAPAHLVSENYFEVLGVPVRFGPGFSQSGANLIISHGFWQREFGGAPDIVGRTLMVNGQSLLVAGVAAPEFRGTDKIFSVDLWIPVKTWARLLPRFRPYLEKRDGRDGTLWARLRPGVTLEAARADVDRVARRMAETWPETNRYLAGHTYAVLQDRERGGLTLTAMGVLLLGLLLAVACANVAGILLAQAEERRHEVAVRQALGASRARLVRQWITESAVLATAGAALGLLGARLIMHVLPSLAPAMPIPLNFEFSLGLRVWLYALALLAASALGFGLVPAWRASRPDVVSGLRRDSAVSLLHVHVPIRSVLIVGQVAMAELLLFGAGIVLDSLAYSRNLNPGIDPRRPVILALLVSAPEEAARRGIDNDSLAARLMRLPGVRGVTYGRSVPLSGMRGPSLQLELPGQAPREIPGGSAGPGFFSTLGVRFASGRDLMPSDGQSVLVNSALAKLIEPSGNATGRLIRVDGQLRQVVGVFEDAAWNTIREEREPRVIALTPARGAGEGTLAVEVAGDPKLSLEAVRKEIAAAEPTSMLLTLSTLRQHYENSLFLERTATEGLYALGLLALLLTAAGLHGVAAAHFARRSKEFGLRLALGASPAQLTGLIFRHSLRLAAAGVSLGLAVAVPLALVAGSKLPRISPWSLPAVGLSSAVVLLVALAAAAHPARRALRLDPAQTLRAE